MAATGVCAWRNVPVHGVLPFSAAWFLGEPSAAGGALVLAAACMRAKVFWLKFLNLGLRFMRESAETVGGAVWVHSAPRQGTQVVILAPPRKGGA